MADFNLICPHCDQPLECPTDFIGADVNCPVCRAPFTIQPAPDPTAPPAGAPVSDQMKQWVVDLRVLVLRMPPVYIKMLLEVPMGWVLPPNGVLPDLALQAVTEAVRARFPQCPVTPIKVRSADSDALRRFPDHTDYRNESCRVWVLGRAA